VLRDLPRDINEQSVIDIESLAREGDQAGKHGHRKENVGIKVRTLVLEALDRRCHQEVQQD